MENISCQDKINNEIQIEKIKGLNKIFKEFENLPVEKKTLSTALGFFQYFNSFSLFAIKDFGIIYEDTCRQRILSYTRLVILR